MNILIPDSWLRDFIKTNAEPDDIQKSLSLCGPSVEKIERVDRDYLYHIEITTNRIDAVSVEGIAREAAAILPRFGFQSTYKEKEIIPFKEENRLPLTVSDPQKLCHRILACVLDNVNLDKSCKKIADRLEKAGVRSLNNVIDITNYLMLELGHPCHVFDYDRVKTGSLIIRYAKKGEKLTTLDGKTFAVDGTDVVIDDGTGRIIDLPGIMGTQNSVVTNLTERIIVFIESNNPLVIRNTSLKLGLRTLAASINEKNPDSHLAKRTIVAAVNLYQQECHARIASPLIDIYPFKPEKKKITITADFINRQIGIKINENEIIKILNSLHFKISKKNNLLLIEPPYFRRSDIDQPVDIVEEVARLYGYQNLPSALMTGDIPLSQKTDDLILEEKIKIMLKYWGYTETYYYSLISSQLINKSHLDKKDHLKLKNPLTKDLEYLRISLIPSMLDIISNNTYFRDDLLLFELAKVYLPSDRELPDEKNHLVISNNVDYYQLKGIIDSLLNELGIINLKTYFTPGHLFHPHKSLVYKKDNSTLITLGAVHPDLLSSFSLNKEVFLAEINLDDLYPLVNLAKIYQPIPFFPPVVENLTVGIDKKIKIGFLMEEIKKSNPFIKEIIFLEKFIDWVTFKVIYQHPQKNLDSEEVKLIRDKIIGIVTEKYHLKIKGYS